MNAIAENTEVAILERVFSPGEGNWSRAASEAILSVGFTDGDRQQMLVLLEKAKADELSAEESATLANYRHVGRLLELMKSKARRSLGNS